MSKRRFTGCALVLLGVVTNQADLSGKTTTAAVQEQVIEGSWNASLYRGEPERTRIQLSVWGRPVAEPLLDDAVGQRRR